MKSALTTGALIATKPSWMQHGTLVIIGFPIDAAMLTNSSPFATGRYVTDTNPCVTAAIVKAPGRDHRDHDVAGCSSIRSDSSPLTSRPVGSRPVITSLVVSTS